MNEEELIKTSELAEKWWLSCQIKPVNLVEMVKYRLFFSRKSLQEFAQKYYNSGRLDGFYRGVESYKRWAAKKYDIEVVSPPKCLLKFRAKVDGKEYLARIFVNDPVTYCKIEEDNSDGYCADGAAVRHPKDQWSSKIATTKSLSNAILSFFEEVIIDKPTTKIDQKIYKAFFDALFKKIGRAHV